MTTWESKYIEALDQRDAVEKQYNNFIELFQQAAQRAVKAEQQGAPSTGGMSNEETEKKVAKLYTELSVKTDKLKLLEDKLQLLTLNHDRLQQEARLHKTKAQNYRDEKQVSSATVQQLQDEILALQIELNASEQKLSKLEAENVALVDRWMKKIAQEADMMNNAIEQGHH